MLKTVGIIFVSDLFLQGKKHESLQNLLNELNLLDYEVEKVSVVPEHEKLITYELDVLVKQCDIVLVIGELNNDVVFKSLGSVTFQDLISNEDFQKPSKSLRFEGPNNYNLPVNTKLITENDLTYPVLQIQRIFVLKEDYLDKLFRVLRKHLERYRSQPKYSKEIRILMNGNTTEVLSKMKEFKVEVACQENDAFLIVTLESTCFDEIVECEKVARSALQNNFMESVLRSNVFNMVFRDPEGQVQQALEVIEECLSRYGPDNVFTCFNGGKDCTVLLHLVTAVMSAKYAKHRDPITCLYIRSENAFPEQDKFIAQCQVYFNLDVMTVQLSIKEALSEVLAKKPNLKACLMGTRRTDPFSSKLNVFQMTDPDWPQVMRVSPVLDWHYCDIWDYLLYYKVPYCKLYDMGFTSLGNAKNTIRNPSLIYYDVRLGKEVYLPAYKMLNEDKERSGRDIRK